jgi:hypothetical protein
MKNRFSVSASMHAAWKIAKANRSLLIKAALTVGLLQIISGLFDVKHVASSGDVIRVLISVAAGILGAICAIGLLHICLKLVRGKPASYNDLIPPWYIIWNFALVSIVTGAIVVLGFIALIIPGIYLMLRFSMARLIVLEEPHLGLRATLRKSTEMTRGVKWELLGLVLVILILNVLGVLALVVGLLVTVPVSMLAFAHTYVTLASPAAQDSASSHVPQA